MRYPPVRTSEVLTTIGKTLNNLVIRVLACAVDNKTGLPADSTGVKVGSNRFKFSRDFTKKLILRASVTSIPSDAVVHIEAYNYTKASVIDYIEFAGATGEGEKEITDLSGVDDGDVIGIRANVVTASATSGAVFDLAYASLMIDYGV